MLGIKARDFFMEFYLANIPLVAVENPVPSKIFVMPEYSQIIQPYQFGHPYTKRTCLWLRNLPPLEPTNVVEPVATWCPSGSYSHKADEIALKLMRLADLESLCSYDHLRELAEADKEGRVVVLEMENRHG